MGFLKRLLLVVMFFPVIVFSGLQVLSFILRWLLFGTPVYENKILYEEIHFK